jgi:hypothetical protein
VNYQTLEVELQDGRVHPFGNETLPAKARALLTILTSDSSSICENSNASIAHLTGDLAAIGQGNYTDLSTNKRHVDDFGR